jgi:hypothetical protein
MSTTQIQPIDVKPIETKLTILRARAEQIQVTDQTSYAAACQIVLDGRAEVKAIGFVLDPGIESAKGHLDTLRNQKKGFVDQITPITAIAERKAEEWKAEERRKAEAEQRRINEERRIEAARVAEVERKERERVAAEERKQREAEIAAAQKAGDLRKREAEKLRKESEAAEARERQRAADDAKAAAENVQEVTVKAAVPTVSGIKARVNWKFKIVDETKIPREYLMPDEVKIGSFVRATKKPGAVIPGIEAYSEDSI